MGDDVTEVFGEAEGGDGCSLVAVLPLLFALAGDAIAGEIVPAVVAGATFERKAGVEVLVGLLAVTGDAEEVVGPGKAGGGDCVGGW